MHIPQQIILLLVILISGGTVAIAQDKMPSVQNRPHVKLGLKTGVNICGAYNIQGENLTTKPRPGFTTGLFANIPLGGRLDFQPEIVYAQRGIRATGTMFSGPYDLTRTTNYIDVSTLVAIKATDMLSLTIGPQASFLTRQRDVFSGSTTPAQREEFRHDNVRKMTVSLVAGPQFNVSPFVLDARLGWDLLRNTKAVERMTPRYSYIWYQFTLGFRFR